MAMHDAVFVAEALDHAKWQALERPGAKLSDDDLGVSLRDAVARGLGRETEHFDWIHDMRTKMTML